MTPIERTLRLNSNMLRAWGLCLAVGCLACTGALACNPSSERSILFEYVPTDLNVPVIVEVTIDDLSEVSDPSNGVPMAVMNARVDRVIKGSVDSRLLKIVTRIGACTRVGVGHGIVAGTLRYDARRGLELVPILGSSIRTWSDEFLREQMNAVSSGRGAK